MRSPEWCLFSNCPRGGECEGQLQSESDHLRLRTAYGDTSRGVYPRTHGSGRFRGVSRVCPQPSLSPVSESGF
ncbi:MAG TPA: hypothetical protein DIC52_22300 [Candidatus Latescibacteria bacterium]|nr:hypothetical protein [Candidatus Latescibacterota bacterium]